MSGSTVKIDTSDELANLYQIARRAKSSNDAGNASKYYEMILIKEPTSWEATFYSVYYRALNCKIYQITSMVNSITNCLDEVFSLIQQYSADNEVAAVTEVATRVEFAVSVFIQNSVNTYGKSTSVEQSTASSKESTQDFCDRVNACNILLLNLGNKLDFLYCATGKEEFKELALSAWKSGNGNNAIMYASFDTSWKKQMLDATRGLCKPFNMQIQQYDLNYQDPLINIEPPSGGCYVATAVYGSYDCPQVWTLRRYRDYTLAETRYGRAFIHTYYAISPTLVKWFGHTKWFKKMWKGKLDRMVANLNAEGVEDTPYEDRNW